MKPTLYCFLLIVFAVAVTALRAPGKTYRCLPCGQACDNKVLTAPGKCSACNMKLVESESITFKTLTFADVCQRLKNNKNVLLLDVRSPGEFNNTSSRNAYGKFKNAVNINVTELEDRVGELSAYKNKEVIVYCSHSHRSPQASYFLSTHGFTNVANVAGGVSELPGDAAVPCLKDAVVRY